MNESITLNGKPYPVAGPLGLHALLDSLGLAGKPVVVELDGRAIFPREHATTTIRPGARLEIVTLAAGG
ncbi:MAG: sulfur carrier protein ThiS [Luteolibacter sp.]